MANAAGTGTRRRVAVSTYDQRIADGTCSTLVRAGPRPRPGRLDADLHRFVHVGLHLLVDITLPATTAEPPSSVVGGSTIAPQQAAANGGGSGLLSVRNIVIVVLILLVIGFDSAAGGARGARRTPATQPRGQDAERGSPQDGRYRPGDRSGRRSSRTCKSVDDE
jgi:hypothetical protein